MQTSNTEEMVTISRAEYERLQQEKARNAKLEAKLAAREQEQAQVITSLTLQNEWLLEQLKLSKKKLFGRSSEQAEQMVMDQLSLTYNELEAYAFGTKAATEKQITVKAHERKRQSGNVLDVVPEGTPTEVYGLRPHRPPWQRGESLRSVRPCDRTGRLHRLGRGAPVYGYHRGRWFPQIAAGDHLRNA